MLIKDKIIKVKIHSRNIKYYSLSLSGEFIVGEIVEIPQEKVQPTSRTEVSCLCDGENCNEVFVRRIIDVRPLTFCGSVCHNQYLISNNPNPEVEKIEVFCAFCGTDFKVSPSKHKKQKDFLCSRECYKEHRRKKYFGNKIYNHQGILVNCACCDKEFKTIEYDLKNRDNLFCSQECYWIFRKLNFKEYYFTSALNEARKETKPEKLMREFLENRGVEFEQEMNIDNKYFADFYLPAHNVIIEVNGDYWHGNPEVYGEGKRELNEYQIIAIKRDRKRTAYLKKQGYEVFIIWENQIYKDIDYYLGKLINELNVKNPQRLHAKPLLAIN